MAHFLFPQFEKELHIYIFNLYQGNMTMKKIIRKKSCTLYRSELVGLFANSKISAITKTYLCNLMLSFMDL